MAAILACGISLMAGVSAHAGFVIIPTFDSTITGDANHATIESTINTAIGIYENDFSDPVTVKIDFTEVSTGLGASSTWIYSTSYTNFLTHLAADAKTTNDAIALAHLPPGPNEPVTGGSTIFFSKANGDAIGIATSPTPDGFNGTISLNTTITNPGSPGSSNAYSLLPVVEHEIDEVLGLGSGLDHSLNIRPEDLFRFTNGGARTYTTGGDNAYFSIDGGTTDLARFNQNSGGDYGDWWSTGTHTPQVQDAFATPGANPTLGVELIALDVIGFDLKSQGIVPEPTSLVCWTLGMVLVGGGVLRKRAKQADRRAA